MEVPERELLMRTLKHWIRAEIDGALKLLIDLARPDAKGAVRNAGSGRPTKTDRRALDKLRGRD